MSTVEKAAFILIGVLIFVAMCFLFVEMLKFNREVYGPSPQRTEARP